MGPVGGPPDLLNGELMAGRNIGDAGTIVDPTDLVEAGRGACPNIVVGIAKEIPDKVLGQTFIDGQLAPGLQPEGVCLHTIQSVIARADPDMAGVVQTKRPRALRENARPGCYQPKRV